MKRLGILLPTLALLAVMLVPRGAGALTIGPPTFDFVLDPGDTALDVIKLYNEDEFPITVYPIVMNFESDDDEGGVPKFYPSDEDRLGRGLAEWIDVDPTPITLEPGQRMSLPFSVNIPTDKVQPGGHYGAVVISTTAPEAGGGEVGIGQQIAALILVRVSGEVKEVGGIAEFGYEDPKPWYNYLPVDFFLRFENSGNTHLRPTGNVFIKNWYGRQVANVKVNPEFKSVLPLSIRRYVFGWAHTRDDANLSDLKREWKNFALGKYTATLVLNYGTENQILTDERVFYVWPWRLLSILGGSVLAIVTLFAVLKRIYDKAVIQKYEAMMKRKKGSAPPEGEG